MPSSTAPPIRMSAGVVIVSLVHRKLQFLLLRAYRNWDFPKGLVEAGEEPIEAAVREVREETTLDDISFDWGTVFMDTGPYNKGKISRYYIARSKETQCAVARESGTRFSGAPRSAMGRLRPGARHGVAQIVAGGALGLRHHQPWRPSGEAGCAATTSRGWLNQRVLGPAGLKRGGGQDRARAPAAISITSPPTRIRCSASMSR